jgi:hypothetical protein
MEICEDFRLLNFQLQDDKNKIEEASLTAECLLALQAEFVEKNRISDDLQHDISRYRQIEMDLKEQMSVLQMEKHSLDHQLALSKKELDRIQIEFTDISEENQWLQERERNLEGREVVQLRETVCCKFKSFEFGKNPMFQSFSSTECFLFSSEPS